MALRRETSEVRDEVTSGFFRAILGDYAKSAATVDLFISEEIREVATAKFKGPPLDAYEHALRTFYPSGLEIIHRHSKSPIKTIFLTSLLFAFLRGDPTGLIIQAPRRDFPQQVAENQKYYQDMVECDTGIRNATANERSILTYIDHLVSSGKMTEDEAEFHRSQFIILHSVNFAQAFHVVLQAHFPSVVVSVRGIKVDMAVWVPANSDVRLIVECDGFKYHNTKSRFAADRKRDRLLQAAGYQVFRFAGTEIWNDPTMAGIELYEFLQKMHRST